jgi:DNA-binding GntR family transcriptional regulator
MTATGATRGEGEATEAERIVGALRRDIVGGRFPPGARLKIQDLSTRYGISMMPVREALRRLEGERLVELNAHRGATVRPVTVKFVRDLYAVREALEGLLVESCAAAAGEAEAREIAALADAWEAAARRGDAARLLEANRRFHQRINEIGDNGEALEMLSRGWPLIHALRLQIGFGERRLAEIAAQHRAIVVAVSAGDPAAARAASRAHCFSARDDLIRQLEHVGAISRANVGAAR